MGWKNNVLYRMNRRKCLPMWFMKENCMPPLTNIIFFIRHSAGQKVGGGEDKCLRDLGAVYFLHS